MQVFLACSLAIALVLAISNATGYMTYASAPQDDLRRADAVVVLAGERDGREHYGLDLVEAGFANTLVLSDPYGRVNSVLDSLCEGPQPVDIVCVEPPLHTTRGEAMAVRDVTEQRPLTSFGDVGHGSVSSVVRWR